MMLRGKNTLTAALNLQPGEGKVVGWMFLHSLLIGFTVVFLATSASTLFLTVFDAVHLSYMYIGIAVVGSIVGYLYSTLQKRISAESLLKLNVGVVFFSLLLLSFPHILRSNVIIVVLYIWWNIVVVLLNLEFWGLAGMLFTIRQGKRLFGIIGSGEVAASVIGGLLVSLLVESVGITNLLFISAASSGLTLLVLFYILKAFGKQLGSSRERKEEEVGSRTDIKALLKNRYVLLIVLYSALSTFAFYFVDNLFYDRANAQYPDEIQLAAFFGDFFAVTGFALLISRLAIGDRLISRYGMRTGLLVHPLFVLLAVASCGTVGILYGLIPLFFWLATSTKLADELCSESISRSTFLLLYQPLHSEKRLQAQMLVESVVEPIAAGLVGVLILAMRSGLGLGPMALVFGLFLILLAWIVVVMRIQYEYRRAISKALQKRTLYGMTLAPDESSSIEALLRGVQSNDASEVLYALHMLEQVEHPHVHSILLDLLSHASDDVRREVLLRIEQLELSDARQKVAERIGQEQVPAIKGIALRIYAALCRAEAVETIAPYVTHPDEEVRQGAAIGLLRNGGIEGVLLAGTDLLKHAASHNPKDRIYAAQVLGAVGITDFYAPLIRLLRDPSDDVRKQALIAAGKLNTPTLWPHVAEHLSTPAIRPTAIATLVAGGESVLPTLENVFNKEHQLRAVQSRIIRIYGQIGGKKVIDLLRSKLHLTIREVHSQVLLALSRCGYRAKGPQVAELHRCLREEVGEAAWILGALKNLEGEHPQLADSSLSFLPGSPDLGRHADALSLVRAALETLFDAGRHRVLLMLSFLYEARSVLRARENFTCASPQRRAYAIEIIDNLIDQKLKAIVLPVLDEISLDERVQRLHRIFPQPSRELSEALLNIAEWGAHWRKPWLQACAIFALAQETQSKDFSAIHAAITAPDSLVRETGTWALHHLDSKGFKASVAQLLSDSNPHIVQLASELSSSLDDENILLTIDKVNYLKRTAIFSETASEVLADVAILLDQVEIEDGNTFIHQGDLGDCMYIIVEGKVGVVCGSSEVASLEAGEIVGEFSILDSEPRSASVIARGHVQLLRLDQAPFLEIMNDRSEIARGIVQVLWTRLRGRMEQNQQDYDPHELSGAEGQGGTHHDHHPSMLGVEKMFLVEHIELFLHASHESFHQIASAFVDVTLAPGEKLFKRGDIDNCLYLMTSGALRLDDEQQTIGYMMDHAVLGELSVLGTEPRTVTITAVEETHLLRLEREHLFTLMADHPELTRDIIRVLCRRIRAGLEPEIHKDAQALS
jgi:AAA family ATP:ADP antiporter